MKSTSTAVVGCLMLSAGQAALAGTNDILLGLDEKIIYGPDGLMNGPPGKEAVLVMDVSNPAKPRIRASLPPLMNSLLGPPTNLQITPDGRLGLVANSVTNVQDGAAWKTVPDDKLFVIDLAASPPKLIDTLTVGKRPSRDTSCLLSNVGRNGAGARMAAKSKLLPQTPRRFSSWARTIR